MENFVLEELCVVVATEPKSKKGRFWLWAVLSTGQAYQLKNIKMTVRQCSEYFTICFIPDDFSNVRNAS